MNASLSFRKLLTIFVAFLLVAFPYVPVRAQSADAPTPSEVPPAPQENESPAPVPLETAPQETISTDALVQTEDPGGNTSGDAPPQETIPSDTLIQTEDPSQTPDEGADTTPLETPLPVEEVIPLPTDEGTEATSTPIEEVLPDPGIPLEEATSTLPVEEPLAELPVEEPVLVDTLSMEDISPEEGYTFTLRGKAIPTRKEQTWKLDDEPKDSQGKPVTPSNAMVTKAPTVKADQDIGVAVVSGTCSNVYFVVLLYKNSTDYDTHPAASVYNRAFPCVNGRYSYAIADIPQAVPNGTYYLLIGEMGETGTWSPITSQVAIDIVR